MILPSPNGRYAIRILWTGSDEVLPGAPLITYYKVADLLQPMIRKHPFVLEGEYPTLVATKEEALRGAKQVQARMDLVEEKERYRDILNQQSLDLNGFKMTTRPNKEYFVRAVVFDQERWEYEKLQNQKMIVIAQEARKKTAFELFHPPVDDMKDLIWDTLKT